MTATEFDAERSYDDNPFSAVEVFRSDRMNVACGFCKPGQFIPVHTLASDVAIHVRSGTGIDLRSGTGIDRDRGTDRHVGPGDVIVVEAETGRGIKADTDSRLEALPVTAPPPTDAEHEPVRTGVRNDAFDPDGDHS